MQVNGRGGPRANAGAKSTWRHCAGGTKLIRVPRELEKQILKAARDIDAGEHLVGASGYGKRIDELNKCVEALTAQCVELHDKLVDKKLEQALDTWDVKVARVVLLLKLALQLKPNAGGAIKKLVREALAILEL